MDYRLDIQSLPRLLGDQAMPTEKYVVATEKSLFSISGLTGGELQRP